MILGLLIGLGAVCPEQILLLAGLALFIAFMGLLGPAPDTLAEGWSVGKQGNIYALVGLMGRRIAPPAAWFGLGAVLVVTVRLVGGGAC